jgi:pSer/pThr/pTyr-binding forkhead associated (FHA) protein
MSDINGTAVNGALVDKAPLANGDLITLGKTTFRFVLVPS